MLPYFSSPDLYFVTMEGGVPNVKTAEELYSIGLSESQGLHANMPLAVAYYTASAAKGDARAAYELALIYNNSRLLLYDEAKAEYEGRRNAAYEELSQIPGIVCQKPGGAFYLTCKLPVEDAEDFLMGLLERHRMPKK